MSSFAPIAKLPGRLMIANRGEIAARILRTASRLDMDTVALYTPADAATPHALDATESHLVDSYLDWKTLLRIASERGVTAVHPGYGFLSENPEFSEACTAAGIKFVGPTPDSMRLFSLKHEARAFADQAGVPVVPGTDLITDTDAAVAASAGVGFPLLAKATAGGGGIGIIRCDSEGEVAKAVESAGRLGELSVGNAGVFLEHFVEASRHIEVQVFGDGKGNVVCLGERECSVQRRNQKVLEETPSSFVDEELRARLFESARALASACNYESAGTVEFLVDDTTGAFYFLEMNTRLQVEHGVTEMVTGVDLVEMMLRQAGGDPTFKLSDYEHKPRGSSIQVRVYAENPARDFQPAPGFLQKVEFPTDLPFARFDTWVKTGTEVSPHYDPMIAKVLVHGDTREEAIGYMKQTLARTDVLGSPTNIDFLEQVVADPRFEAGDTRCDFVEGMTYSPRHIDVDRAGTLTSLQSYPGRVGYWNVGVPMSGPMDPFAMRMAQRLVGNEETATGLELTVQGPKLKLHQPTVFALTGAHMTATLNGEPVPYWTPVSAPAGSVLDIGKVEGNGCRTYLAFAGGIDCPEYLGSTSTFDTAKLGGLQGRNLRGGDTLPLPRNPTLRPAESLKPLAQELVPEYGNTWEIGAVYGPHGAPDFLTEEYMEEFWGSEYGVHYNSNRLGMRLLTGKPKAKRWARNDGGEAGLHPSNVHDTVYAIGSVNFTGDMPVVLNVDGPSLGGFVCPITIAQSELWKIGQAKPGDKIRFKRISMEQAKEGELAQNATIASVANGSTTGTTAAVAPATGRDLVSVPRAFNPAQPGMAGDAVLARLNEGSTDSANPQVVYRAAGDKYMLIEYGPLNLDLRMRVRVAELTKAIEAHGPDGVLELSPGVRSLQVKYDNLKLSPQRLLDFLVDVERSLADPKEGVVPSRVLRLPMAYDDHWNQDAIEVYRKSVRDKAPYLPSNLEFIARINGVTEEDVKRIVYDASYMVFGLGDVYLGAPCAVAVDPRHRLVTSKYNPARTYTPEGSVGIGGAYMCIYGMDSPGGYQLVGRTLPIWSTYLTSTRHAQDGAPWLLRQFDQVQYYEVDEKTLVDMRRAFRAGHLDLDVEETTFSVAEYESFLAEEAASIDAFRAQQAVAFEEELEMWHREGFIGGEDEAFDEAPAAAAVEVPVGCTGVESPVNGLMWKVKVAEGESVVAGQALAIVESMKMEFVVTAPHDGVVRTLVANEGAPVSLGDNVVVVGQ